MTVPISTLNAGGTSTRVSSKHSIKPALRRVVNATNQRARISTVYASRDVTEQARSLVFSYGTLISSECRSIPVSSSDTSHGQVWEPVAVHRLTRDNSAIRWFVTSFQIMLLLISNMLIHLFLFVNCEALSNKAVFMMLHPS